MHVTIVTTYGTTINNAILIAVADGETEDPIGAHTVAVVQRPDGRVTLVTIESIATLRRTDGRRVARS